MSGSFEDNHEKLTIAWLIVFTLRLSCRYVGVSNPQGPWNWKSAATSSFCLHLIRWRNPLLNLKIAVSSWCWHSNVWIVISACICAENFGSASAMCQSFARLKKRGYLIMSIVDEVQHLSVHSIWKFGGSGQEWSGDDLTYLHSVSFLLQFPELCWQNFRARASASHVVRVPHSLNMDMGRPNAEFWLCECHEANWITFLSKYLWDVLE